MVVFCYHCTQLWIFSNQFTTSHWLLYAIRFVPQPPATRKLPVLCRITSLQPVNNQYTSSYFCKGLLMVLISRVLIKRECGANFSLVEKPCENLRFCQPPAFYKTWIPLVLIQCYMGYRNVFTNIFRFTNCSNLASNPSRQFT